MRDPLIVVRDYNAGLPASLRLGGVALVRDVDWLPSLRPDRGELWITLKRDLSGPANRLEIQP